MAPNPRHVTISRRKFLKRAGLALAAPVVVPAAALGRAGATAPGDRVGIGVIGVGGRGMGHLRALLGFNDVQILAARQELGERVRCRGVSS